jgi:retron-type reverse transcriptase
LNRAFLWNIDLRDFFPSIRKTNVQEAFLSIGYPVKAALLLSSICCLDGKLPQGAPTSPALANLIFTPIDTQIAELVRKANVVYTRYADDLSFSALKPITPDLRRRVMKVITDGGFWINEDKTRLMGPKCCRQVTGLTVNNRLSIPRQRRRQLRARFHSVQKNPTAFVSEKEQLVGFASWVFDYHPLEGKKYLEIAHSIPNGS